MRRATFLTLALAVAALLVPSVLRSEEIPFLRDLLDFFLPMKAAYARSLLGGDIPWWDPWTAGGQPFFATLQSQVLYPPNLLFLAPAPEGWLLSVFIALHFAWAGLGAASVAQELGARPAAAAVALLATEAGGFLVSLADLLNQACAQAWMPWILLFACRHARSGSNRDLAGWAACLAMAFLAGEPQYAALAGVASSALACALGGRRAIRGAAAAALLSLIACAVQIVPLAELVARSTRATSSFQEGGRHALEPSALLALVRAPSSAFGGPAGVLVESLHLGVVVVLLVAAAAALRRDAVTRVLLAGSAVSILLALGPHVPLLGRLQIEALPFLRYPIKSSCVAAAFLPLLAALGAEALLARPGRLRETGRAALAGILLVLAAADLVRAQRVLVPSLPARELLAPTPLIAHLQRETSPDGPRVHSTPVTAERLARRAERLLAGDLAGAMRERVELLEGALPMYFGVAATWSGSALPPSRQEALLAEATGPVPPPLARALHAGWLVDAAPRVLPLRRVDVDGGAARLYLLEGGGPHEPRAWRGPNEAVGRPGAPPPSDWPGWRETSPGTWRFRPTGLVPCAVVSALGWLALAALALFPRWGVQRGRPLD
jgi:hypothetical protein